VIFLSRTERAEGASRPASFHAGCSHPERGISVGLPSDFISSHRGTQRAQRHAVDCSAPININHTSYFTSYFMLQTSCFVSSHRATQRTRSFVIFVRRSMPVNAKYKETQQAASLRGRSRHASSFGCLPDVKFLFGTDFATDGHCRTDQH
jgi:hypothetical protein